MLKRSSKVRDGARERLLGAAYQLMVRKGVNRVGVDAILDSSQCAKASLYTNFGSKVELAIAVLDEREKIWTRGWLESEIRSRSPDPAAQLLAIFDVFDGWFRQEAFEGCTFINVLLDSDTGSPTHAAAAAHLAKIRAILRGLAKDAGLKEPEHFAQAWHMLMKGSIVAAGEGHRNAARDAKRAAKLILDGWPRR